MSKIRVTIADDHVLFAGGLSSIVTENKNVEVVDKAYDGDAAVASILKHKPDIAFLDLDMPKKTGFEVLHALKDANLSTKIMIISMHDTERYIMEAIDNGACGFISKTATPAEILLAIDSIMENGIYFNEAVNKAMLHKMVVKKKLKPVFGNHLVEFTPRETEVLLLIAKEMNSPEIADKLGLSVKTVEGLRKNMFDKAGVRNVVGLALYAQRNGLLK